MSLAARLGGVLVRAGRRLQGTPSPSGVQRETIPRDTALGNSPAAPASRQVWSLWRAREESRNLSLTSPYWRAFLAWAKAHALGEGRSRLSFPRVGPDQAQRLADVLEWIRDEWTLHQSEPIGARDETLPQLAGHALWHRLVDGDAFLVRYRAGAGRRYQFFGGDALAEEDYLGYRYDVGRRRALGITYDERGRPLYYHFGWGAKFRPLECGWSGATDQVALPERDVLHVRERREDGLQIRTFPHCTAVIDWLNRLGDYYFAFVRGAIRRAAFGLFLEVDPEQVVQSDTALLESSTEVKQAEAMGQEMAARVEQRLAYRYARERAGESFVADPGYKVANPFLPAPSPQEAETLRHMEQVVGGGLRCSIATLIGDYRGANFSGSQQGTLQERETITDLQTELVTSVFDPLYADFWADRWPQALDKFPRVMPEDQVLLVPQHRLRRPAVLEKHRIIPSVLKAFWEGIMTLEETRQELGLPTADLAAIAAQVQADHAMLEGMRPGADAAAPAGENDDEPQDEEEREEERREREGG